PCDIERFVARDECDVVRYAGVIHREDIQTPESAQQDDRGGPWADSLELLEERRGVVTRALLQHRDVERSRGKRLAGAPERRDLARAEPQGTQGTVSRAQHSLGLREQIQRRAFALEWCPKRHDQPARDSAGRLQTHL